LDLRYGGKAMGISTQEVLELLREDPSFREEVRRLVLTDELLNMPRQMAVLTSRVEGLATQMQALTTRVDSLAARVDDLTAQMQALTTRVDDLTAQMQELARIQRGMLIDIGDMKGKLAEMEYRDKVHGYLGGIVRRTRLIEPDRLWDILDDALGSGRITPDEERQVRSADMIVQGLKDGSPVWLVVEVSWKVGREDVERASRRAGIWAKCVEENVLAVAAGSQVDPQARDLAGREGVWLVLDGKVNPPGG